MVRFDSFAENGDVVAPMGSVYRIAEDRPVENQRQSWNQRRRQWRRQVRDIQKRFETTVCHDDIGLSWAVLKMTAACFACAPCARGSESVHVTGLDTVRTTPLALR